MPILERDPWRTQYFTDAECPETVMIPTDDADAWLLYPHYRWVYDKLRIAHSQGLEAAPHGVPPSHYPVFSKPIVNLKGMGIGSSIIHSDDEIAYSPGYFWMDLLEGPHVSTDYAVVDGRVMWGRQAIGVPGIEGTFKYWRILAVGDVDLDRYLSSWVFEHLNGYTGMLNLETIGGRIIEAHLRFADQWPDLYGMGWVQALVTLYAEQRWVFTHEPSCDGFSVPLFARHGHSFMHPSSSVQAAVLATPGITSLQISFHENIPPAHHAMPPGGFRLCIINCVDLAAGLRARNELAKHFHGAEFIESVR